MSYVRSFNRRRAVVEDSKGFSNVNAKQQLLAWCGPVGIIAVNYNEKTGKIEELKN
jgi:hypothetical protein